MFDNHAMAFVAPWLFSGFFTVGCHQSLLDDDLVGVYFVRLTSEPAEVAGMVSDIATDLDLNILQVYDSASEGFSVYLPHLLVPDLQRVQGVESVLLDEEQKYVEPLEPDSDAELGAGEVPNGVERIGGPYTGTADLSQIHVAVLDTGIDSTHPDLDVVAEADIVGDSWGDRAEGSDPNGHGTHVAGTIGAKANGSGVAGVAPGVSLHAVRVLDESGSGYYSDIVAGMEYVLEHPEIRVVNLSLGGPMSEETEPLREAIERVEQAGVIVVIAAGNEGQQTENVAPAGYGVGVVVSAYDCSAGDQGFAWFSNFGDEVDIASPGVSINSTWPGGDYEILDGTSMAAPHVAGAAAVYAATNPTGVPEEFRAALVSSGEDGLIGQDSDHPEPLVDLAALISATGG